MKTQQEDAITDIKRILQIMSKDEPDEQVKEEVNEILQNSGRSMGGHRRNATETI